MLSYFSMIMLLKNNCYLRVNKACQERLECQEKEVLENLVLRYVINRGIYLFIFEICVS